MIQLHHHHAMDYNIARVRKSRGKPPNVMGQSRDLPSEGSISAVGIEAGTSSTTVADVVESILSV